MTEHTLISMIDHAGEIGEKGKDEVCVFAQNDPYGALMAVLGMGIVFIILLLLYLIFSNTPKLYTIDFKEKLTALFSIKKKKAVLSVEEMEKAAKPEEISGEVGAAIAAALHLYRSEMHDYENTVLTIQKVSRTYSPWSSKIYGLRNMSVRKP